MRNIINLFENDFEYDEYDGIEQPKIPFQFLNSLDKYKANKHIERKNRIKWREKQQQKYRYDVKDYWNTEFMTKRGVQKSIVGYKPFKFPLIRFGKFGKASRNFLPIEFRREMGNVTHEAGVSCYSGIPYKDGYQFKLPHTDRASYNVTNSFIPTEKELKGILNYIDHKTPMEIFLIHGHLKSHGKSNDWLDLGADGEYLLDTSKPFKQEFLLPTKVYIGDKNLIDYILSSFFKRDGIEGIRKHLNFE